MIPTSHGAMSTQAIVDHLTYASYRANRSTMSAAQLARIFPNAAALEAQYLRDYQMSEVCFAIEEALEYFEQREDASTDSGDWQGNEEMHLASGLRAALEVLKRATASAPVKPQDSTEAK